MKRGLFALACLGLCLSASQAADPSRCVSLEFSAAGFRNVTEPGDVRILPSDEVVLVNKREPEATRIIFGQATPAHSPVVTIKDCGGTAHKFVLTISGEIDAGAATVDGNYGSQALRRVGKRWMLQ